MDSLFYPGTEKWRHNAQSHTSTKCCVADRRTRSDIYEQDTAYERRTQPCHHHSDRHVHVHRRASEAEMSNRRMPIVNSAFTMPRSVFNEVLGQQGATFHRECVAAPFRIYSQSGNETKRPRLSSTSPRCHHVFQTREDGRRNATQDMREQQRLNRTRREVLKLLKLKKLQRMQQLLASQQAGTVQGRDSASQCHTTMDRINAINRGDVSSDLLRRQHRMAIHNAHVHNGPRQGPSGLPYRIAQDGRSSFQAPSRDLRRRPSIHVIVDTSRSSGEEKSYSCKSNTSGGSTSGGSTSGGLAMDHQSLPKIVAVHSVLKHATTNSSDCVTSPTYIPVESSTINLTSGAKLRRLESMRNFGEKSDRVHQYREQEVERRELEPRARQSHFEFSFERDCDDEVSVRHVAKEKARRSTSTTTSEKNSHDVIDLTDCTESRSTKKSKELPKKCHRTESADDQVGETGFDHPGHVDPKLDFGGSPPYLPVLNRSDSLEEKEEEAWPHSVSTTKVHESPRRNSVKCTSPTSPKLTKTIPEISDKLIETKERIKNETIDWKKKILLRLEKVLMKKLRRVESQTGERCEIEGLREELTEKESNTKKTKGTSPGRRRSRQDSVKPHDDTMTEQGIQQNENALSGEKKESPLRQQRQISVSSDEEDAEIADNSSANYRAAHEVQRAVLEQKNENGGHTTKEGKETGERVDMEETCDTDEQQREVLRMATEEGVVSCKGRQENKCFADKQNAGESKKRDPKFMKYLDCAKVQEKQDKMAQGIEKRMKSSENKERNDETDNHRSPKSKNLTQDYSRNVWAVLEKSGLL